MHYIGLYYTGATFHKCDLHYNILQHLLSAFAIFKAFLKLFNEQEYHKEAEYT